MRIFRNIAIGLVFSAVTSFAASAWTAAYQVGKLMTYPNGFTRLTLNGSDYWLDCNSSAGKASLSIILTAKTNTLPISLFHTNDVTFDHGQGTYLPDISIVSYQ